MTLKRVRYKPNLNAPCLCGSGVKFKRCCMGNNDAHCVTMIDSARELLLNKDYKGALKLVRLGITNYSILHKTNTEPYIFSDNEAVLRLLSIDIKALSELVESLLDCYRGLHDYSSFECDLERLRNNISDARWQKKITYFQILASLGEHWSEKIGKREVKKLLPIDEENDVEIIQLYLHFCSYDLSFKKNIDILDRLLSLIEKPREKLQYSVVKGIKYLSIGDTEESQKIIEEAIKDYESTDWANDSCYGLVQHARAISLLGDLKRSVELKALSVKEFISLLDNHKWTDSGVADIHAEIGRSLFHIRKFDEAIEHYEKSLLIADSNLVRIYLSQVKMDLNDKTAIDLIKKVEINISKLSESELIDFIFTYASISISFNDKEMIEKSLNYLMSSPSLEFIFEKQKNEIITQITNLYVSGNLKTQNSVLTKLKNLLSRTSRYLILQPNIAGLGININNIVQDFTSGSDKEK
ncbi:TPA: SEC-C metal-binding domain-containing protein [Serratia marcescens]